MPETSDELALLRRRIAAMEATIARLEKVGQAAGAAAFLGTVYDGGDMPDAAGRIYLVHPTAVGGPETEGATPTFTVDEAQAIPVLMARCIPAEGDRVLAERATSRWVGG